MFDTAVAVAAYMLPTSGILVVASIVAVVVVDVVVVFLS